jgi:hypothetical protein
MSITLVDRAIERCRSSQRNMDTSYRLLVLSSRLLHRGWWISGGADVDGNGNNGTKGVVHIECRRHGGEPSEYLVSFGGHSSGVFYLGKASGFDPLTALLRRLGVPAPALRIALQVLMAEPRHKIPNMILTQDHFRALGLGD